MNIYVQELYFLTRCIVRTLLPCKPSKSNSRLQLQFLNGIYKAVTLACACIILTLAGCQSVPDPLPCDCGVAEKEMRKYMLQYFDALEDVGTLRQELKACSERR